jgi:hypothetical protein
MAQTRSFIRVPRHLYIEGFSSFTETDITLNTLTIITGPQASGKSLVCKLSYFFQDIFSEILSSIQNEDQFQSFVELQERRFSEWFPPSAWGARPFSIKFSADGFSIEVTRKIKKRKPSEFVSIKFSEAIEAIYDGWLEAFLKQKDERKRDPEFFPLSYSFYRLSLQLYKIAYNSFGNSVASHQTYIPASRTFFTTIGKAMSAFEHGQLLDPITKEFGRNYVGLIERSRHGPMLYGTNRGANNPARRRYEAMAGIFGGRPKIERNEMVIEASDGRIIPLFALSSGQQELLPLWLTLDYYENLTQYSDINGTNFLYIEEPEAHLFPKAQAGILEILAAIMRRSEVRAQMVVTTHSPYLLAKANNLLFAGQAGYRRRKEKQARIEKIVPKSRWLIPNEVSCYALENGRAIDLIGHDGLISTDYIDEVSQDIVEEFERLVDL